jgi:hypothetical protein
MSLLMYYVAKVAKIEPGQGNFGMWNTGNRVQPPPLRRAAEGEIDPQIACGTASNLYRYYEWVSLAG